MKTLNPGEDLGFGPLSKEDVAALNRFHPASGHLGGWRVVRGYCPMEQAEGPKGRVRLFRTMGAAQRAADRLNA